MQLFKRVLLSLFPDEVVTQNMNPASMFVSFISSKEFFSVITRKIVENYKLNLFDIALDPFEFKVGFGEKPSLKAKDMDLYYGYCAAANLNGYRFFNPANMANCLALVASLYVKDIFTKYPQEYFLNFLYTIYLLSFVFLARIKSFPDSSKEEKFNWFVDVFFSFYAHMFQQTGSKFSSQKMDDLKKELMGQIDIFFVLFEFYQKMSDLFISADVNEEEFYAWIFYDEMKKKTHKTMINDFIKNAEYYRAQSKFSLTEKKILPLILPADILLRYLFMDSDIFLTTEYIVSKIYDKEKLDGYVQSIRNDPIMLEEFLSYITDHRHLKKGFFSGVQKYVITVFRDTEDEPLLQEDLDELDDLMSSIGDDFENLESFKVPERIKKESKLMEKLLNFYVTLMGGMRTARGDTFFLRLFRRDLMKTLLEKGDMYDDKKGTLNYYGSLLYNYGKNVFYYKYASENVRSGKQRFFVPYKSTNKQAYSNMCILRLFDENFLATLLQDINIKDIRVYVKNKKILQLFRESFGDTISCFIEKDSVDFVQSVYSDYDVFLTKLGDFSDIVSSSLRGQDIYCLKENLYHVDFWVVNVFVKLLGSSKLTLSKFYSDLSILGIMASLKETLFGFLLYLTFITEQEKDQTKKLHTEVLFSLYFSEVLGLDNSFHEIFKINLLKVFDQFSLLLTEWLQLDDNVAFLQIALENRENFIDKKTSIDIKKAVIGEDIVWLRGFLKNITYYNKRFLIPK